MITLDLTTHDVWIGKTKRGPKTFTPKEKKLLITLARASGKVVSRDVLMQAMGNESYLPEDSRTVDQHLARIRGKAGKYGATIQTISGYGYRADGITLTGDNGAEVGNIKAVSKIGGKTPFTLVTVKIPGNKTTLRAGAQVVLA